MNTAQIEAEIIDLHDELDELEESCDYLEYTLNRALEISDKIKRLGTENIRKGGSFVRSPALAPQLKVS